MFHTGKTTEELSCRRHYLRNTFTYLLVQLEVSFIITVLQVIFGHPLIVSISTLSRYASYSGITTKIHLKPLVTIICESWPGSSLASIRFKIQSGLYGGVVVINLWRCSYLSIYDRSIFHTKRCNTTCIIWNKIDVIWNYFKHALRHVSYLCWLTRTDTYEIWCAFVWFLSLAVAIYPPRCVTRRFSQHEHNLKTYFKIPGHP